MCGIPAHHLEQYTEKLREQFDVTIAAIPEPGTERRIFTLRSVDHEAEAAINAQEAEFGADGTRVFHAPKADLPQPTVQDYLDRYTPVVIAAVLEDTAYRNACGHTDRENAQIECNAAVRRAVLQMKNTELLKPFLDMPEFRSRLHSEVFDGTYAQLHELLRPLSQDDIDDALRRWNGDIASKRAVYRHMSTHGRESGTAAWLEQEFSAEKKPFIVRPGSPESYEMPWAYVVKLELPELKEMVSLLRYSSNNLNQLTKRVHETGRFYDADLEELQQSQERLWDAAQSILAALSKL